MDYWGYVLLGIFTARGVYCWVVMSSYYVLHHRQRKQDPICLGKISPLGPLYQLQSEISILAIKAEFLGENMGALYQLRSEMSIPAFVGEFVSKNSPSAPL